MLPQAAGCSAASVRPTRTGPIAWRDIGRPELEIWSRAPIRQLPCCPQRLAIPEPVAIGNASGGLRAGLGGMADGELWRAALAGHITALADYARYAPGQAAPERVCAGQGHTQQPSPEPWAQVRILPGALFKGINSNSLTILGRLSARPVTCGNADAFRTWPPVRPRNQDPSRGKPSSAANHNDGH
jgi:hypothetical protein